VVGAPCLDWVEHAHSGLRAGVAEWQTRQTQNLLPVREWGFKSLHPHQSGLPPTKIGRLAPTVDGLRKARAQGGDERSEIVGRNNGQEILRGEATSRCGDDRHVCSQGCQQISRPLFRDGRLHD
jgi:hypothetical protein